MKPTHSYPSVGPQLSCQRRIHPSRSPVVALLGTAFACWHAAAAPFAPVEEIGTFSASVDWLEVADIDGDGRKDVLSAGPGTTLRWFRQLEDLTFVPMPGLTLSGSEILDASISDMDLDGRADLLVKSEASGLHFTRLEYDGAGGLTTLGNDYIAAPAQSNERTGVLDHGDLGSPAWVLTTNYGGFGHVSLATSSSDHQQNGSPTSPGAIATGYFRAGSRLDYVIAAREPERVEFFRHKGPEFFEYFPPLDFTHAYSPITDLRVADFDRDGLDDLLIVASNTVSGEAHALSIRKSNGNGFGASSNVAAASLSHFAGADAADLDEDGDADVCALRVGLAPGGVASPECTAYLNNGTGSFNQQLALAHPSSGRAMEIEDLDHDGDQDLIVLTNGGLVLFRNVAVQAAARPSILSTGNVVSPPVDVISFDPDDDGDDDICTAGIDGFLRFHEMDNGLPLAPQVLTSLAQGTTDLASGDMDGDGRPDLVYVSETQQSLRWLNIPEPGGVLAKHVIASVTLPRGLCLVDFDHKFDLEVLTCSRGVGTGEVILCQRDPANGGAWTTATLIPNVPDGFRVWAGQLFQTWARGVVVQTSSGLGSAVHYFIAQPQPATGWDKVTLHESPHAARDLKVGDLNGDGRPDIMAGDAAGLRYWLNTGAGFGLPRELSRVPAGRIVLADLNGNADLDGAFATPSGIFWTRPTSVAAGQPDQRGDQATNSYGSNSFAALTHVTAGDFNHDGLPDLASVTGQTGVIHILHSQRSQTALYTNTPTFNALPVAPGMKVIPLSLTMESQGRAVDASVLLKNVALRFTKDSQGIVPMTPAEITQIVAQVQILRVPTGAPSVFAPDDGVALLNHVPVPAGSIVTVPLDLSPMPVENFTASAGSSRRYLVVLVLKSTAGSAGISDFWVWHADRPGNPRTLLVHALAGATPSDWPVDWLPTPTDPKQQIEIRNLTPLETWRNTHFGYHLSYGEGADDNDADADGVANLVEYAQSTLPKAAASVRRLAVQATAAGQPLVLFSLGSPQPSGIRVQVESSPSLADGSWLTRAERISGSGWSGSLLPAPVGFVFQGVQSWSISDPAGVPPTFYRVKVLVEP